MNQMKRSLHPVSVSQRLFVFGLIPLFVLSWTSSWLPVEQIRMLWVELWIIHQIEGLKYELAASCLVLLVGSSEVTVTF